LATVSEALEMTAAVLYAFSALIQDFKQEKRF
jgi:hypothetical protein